MAEIINIVIHAPHLSESPTPVEKRLIQPLGLGDAVHAAAQPVVQLVKALGGPDLSGCGGCGKRQAALNKLMPQINPFAKSG